MKLSLKTLVVHTWLVGRKTALEMLREPQLALLMLSMPMFFMVITALGYGSQAKLATYEVLTLLEDPAGKVVLERLAALRYPDGRPVFHLAAIPGRSAAEPLLADGRAAALVVLSRDASGHLAGTLRGDATSMKFNRASTYLARTISPLLDQLAFAGVRPQPLVVEERSLFARSMQTEFDLYAVGMMVFAVLLLIPWTAMLLARELRLGTLRRLQLTRLSSLALAGGVTLAQMAGALLMVLVLLGSALALDFHIQGSLALAVVTYLLLCFSAIGPGLVVAGFSRNDSDALNIGSMVTMLMVFLSGAFFPMPAVTLFYFYGHAIDLFDFLPASHAMLALNQVLVDGAALQQVAFRLGLTAVLSFVYYGIGMWFFTRRHYRLG